MLALAILAVIFAAVSLEEAWRSDPRQMTTRRTISYVLVLLSIACVCAATALNIGKDERDALITFCSLGVVAMALITMLLRKFRHERRQKF